MKLKKIFKNFERHLSAYICLAVVGGFCGAYFLGLKNMPRNEENFAVFVGSKGENCYLKELLEENSPDYVRRIEYRNFDVRNSTFNQQFRNFGQYLSDLIILPETKIISEDVPILFEKLSDEFMSELRNDLTYYFYSEFQYGVKIHTKFVSDNTFLDYGIDSEDEDYYLFLKKSSIHNGELTNSEFDTSLHFLKVITDETI